MVLSAEYMNVTYKQIDDMKHADGRRKHRRSNVIRGYIRSNAITQRAIQVPGYRFVKEETR